MNGSIIRTLIVCATVSASALALAVSAIGATRPDDRAGARGADPAVAATQVTGEDPGSSARPDNRAGILGIGSESVDASASAGTTAGFSWADAGIGAGATAGVLMLLSIAALVAIPKRQQRRATV
jgi:hypothetical protein